MTKNIELESQVAVDNKPTGEQKANDDLKKQPKSLSAFEVGLALVATIVGGGIVGIPYAMLHTGIPLGITLILVLAVICWYTGSLYLRAKDLSPTYVESMYELGYVTMGTASIYILSVIILISGLGCMIIYFIVFSDISKSLVDLAYKNENESILQERYIYVLALAVIMIPLCLKKRMAEMKIVSILLFASIAIFIILFLVQLLTLGTIENHDEKYGQYYTVQFDMELVTGFNILVLAGSYHMNLFPTYESLGQNKSSKNGLKAVAIGSALSSFIYISLGFLSIYTFGSALGASVLDNVDEEDNVYSYIIRISFLLVLACHIPYVFFPTKESFLIIFDEAKNSSMANAIKSKLEKKSNKSINGDEIATDKNKDDKDSELAYLKMPAWKYYTLTLILYVAAVLVSIFVEDIAVVFDFIGAFGLSMTSFTIPGVMYLLMIRKADVNKNIETDRQRKCNIVGSIAVIALSIFNMVLVIVKTVYDNKD